MLCSALRLRSILPLDVICNRIQADVMNTLKDDEDTKAVLLESMGLLAAEPAKPVAALEQREPVTVGVSTNGAAAPRRKKAPLVLSDYLE